MDSVYVFQGDFVEKNATVFMCKLVANDGGAGGHTN